MRTKFKQWAVDFLNEHPEIVIEKINKEDPFFLSNLCVEIGSGKGDFIVGMAQKYPEKHFLAIEKVKTIAGMMSKKIFDLEINNIRVFANDTELIFDQLNEGQIENIFLNFSDPWPKKKHAKRRLTFHTFLDKYYLLLEQGGYIYFKTDNDGLYEFTLEEISSSKFELVSNEENYELDENKDVMTEYERKYRKVGKKIHRIVLLKR